MAVLLLLVVIALLFRQPLADALWPASKVQALLDAGDAALHEGRLDAADGSGARQSYEAALALDSDRSEARAGLTRVANAAIGQARTALRDGRLADANESLKLARELQAPRELTDAVAAELRERQAASAGVEQWLAQAAEALAEHRLDGAEDAALPLYQRVLAVQPQRVEALEGREDALTDLLQQAWHALGQDDLAAAAAMIAAADRYDAGHAELPQARAELSRVREQRRRQADRALQHGQLDRAQALYRQVLAAGADDAAQRGLEQVVQAHARAAAALAADFRFDEAERQLAAAKALQPDAVAVRDAERALQRARQAHAQSASLSLPGAERQRRVQTLLDEIARAETRGEWIAPPGDSAYDKLRSAQSLAPDSAEVKAVARRVTVAVQACFEDELRRNRVRRAQACFDAWQTLDARSDALADARRRLAGKWIATGEERLRAGDVAFATQAVKQARATDAAAPGLAEFAARVRDAGG
ncbi:hypothetical protein CSC70_10395 [Pseudoxanthomonas kalamensis DSM 18571]|uniref:hypothetical protein n=1 Tax=Pseudoxanthomonas kalamensis TaxID=289483 RepID=UPI001390BE13|nr:hypothetical protein CSC70_10395 [Pseudoxanthomonas kalamensis DSM 18571]